MGDANVRRPVATRFEHGVDFGLLVHKSPFMADDRDPLVLSNYIFELLEVNPGDAGFLIQLHPDDVDAVVESVTAHAEKGAGTKTTLYVGQEEEEVEEVEEEEEDAGGVGAGGRKEKPHNPLMISVQKVRIVYCLPSPVEASVGFPLVVGRYFVKRLFFTKKKTHVGIYHVI